MWPVTVATGGWSQELEAPPGEARGTRRETREMPRGAREEERRSGWLGCITEVLDQLDKVHESVADTAPAGEERLLRRRRDGREVAPASTPLS